MSVMAGAAPLARTPLTSGEARGEGLPARAGNRRGRVRGKAARSSLSVTSARVRVR
jgi:hypothetical protein